VETSTWEFWAGAAGVTGLVFGNIGLFFVWSVALISPPSANRMFPVRVYSLGLWAAEAVGFGIWSNYTSVSAPMAIWAISGCGLFALQMVIAVCERDEWGSRVAARIPRRVIFRIPAFFLYSGAAGGIAFSVIGVAVTALGFEIWTELLPRRVYDDYEKAAQNLALFAAYMYCYCLTAALFRRGSGSVAFRSGYTWIVFVILCTLGSTLPYLLQFALFEPHSRYGHPDEMTVLFLTSPAVMIHDAQRNSNSHIVLTVTFLVVWGLSVTLVNAGWLLRQVAKFRPPVTAERARA
jgi:hypothetical protein